MAKTWEIERFCDRCLLHDKKVKARAQWWGNGEYRLTCSDASCNWSLISRADWSIGSHGLGEP